MKTAFRLSAILAILILSACADVAFFSANLPTHFDEVQVHKDITFGPRVDEKLDIYFTPGAESEPARPVIVFFYGGRWEMGRKDEYRFVGSAFAKQGFVTVIADYRKYPEVKFPAFVEDAAAAIAWASDHIAEYGGDPKRIYVAGHSAGAHIGALAVTDPHYLAAYGKKRSIVRGFAGLAGPYSFVPDEDDLKDMFRPPKNYPKMQTTTFIDGKQPPMLLLWGDADESVGRKNLDKLVAAIHDKGGCVKTEIYPGVSHNWLIGTLSWAGGDQPPVLHDITNFFEKPDCETASSSQ